MIDRTDMRLKTTLLEAEPEKNQIDEEEEHFNWDSIEVQDPSVSFRCGGIELARVGKFSVVVVVAAASGACCCPVHTCVWTGFRTHARGGGGGVQASRFPKKPKKIHIPLNLKTSCGRYRAAHGLPLTHSLHFLLRLPYLFIKFI